MKGGMSTKFSGWMTILDMPFDVARSSTGTGPCIVSVPRVVLKESEKLCKTSNIVTETFAIFNSEGIRVQKLNMHD